MTALSEPERLVRDAIGSSPCVVSVSAEDCRHGIQAAHERLTVLGTSEAEIEARGGPSCHHEEDAVGELRRWRYLLDGTVT